MKKNNLSEDDLDKLLESLSNSTYAPSSQYSAEKSYCQLEKKLATKKVKRLSLVRYAAAISLVFIMSLSILLYLDRDPEMITVATANYTKEIILPDGSNVTLSHYSSLQYPVKFKKDSRQVEIKGEAYFDVFKDKEHPFVVLAENIQIKVLGTQFNVESYSKDDYIKTTLVEGSVSVCNNKNNDAIILSPNESALFYKANETLYKEYSEKAKDEIAWRDGKLIFNNKTIEQIAVDLSNYFNVSIVVNDTSLKEYKVTARFDNEEGIEEILNILQSVANFNWTESDSTITITPIN